MAHYTRQRGRTPAILLRGYSADEPLVHRRLVPDGIVVPDPDRLAGARRAVERGADVLVLDDAYQLLGVARDLNIVLVSAESDRASRWPLPAGPWREGWEALGRPTRRPVALRAHEHDERPGVALAAAGGTVARGMGGTGAGRLHHRHAQARDGPRGSGQ